MPVLQIIFLSLVFLLIALFLKKKFQLNCSRKQNLIIFAGSMILVGLSFFVNEQKNGGTILQTRHGWPHFYYIYQIKDVLDKIVIDKWIFTPGSFFIYPISNILFFFSFLFLIFTGVQFFKKKKIKLICSFSFLAFAIGIVAVINFFLIPKSLELKIKNQINKANYCDNDSDCVDAGGKCPFGCYAYVNKKETGRISALINSYGSKCIYGCISCPTAVCNENVCKEVCKE